MTEAQREKVTRYPQGITPKPSLKALTCIRIYAIGDTLSKRYNKLGMRITYWITLGLSIFVILVISYNTLGKKTTYKKDISTGQIIGYGKPIPPPYAIYLKEETIYINGVRYFPRQKRTKDNKKTILITEKSKQVHLVIQQVWEEYHRLIKYHNPEVAKKKIIEFARQIPMIKEIKFSGQEPTIVFSDGTKILLLTNTRSNAMSKNLPIHNQYKQKQIKRLKRYLREGALILFGEGYEIIVPPHQSKEFLERIREILLMNIPNEEKRAYLLQFLPHYAQKTCSAINQKENRT